MFLAEFSAADFIPQEKLESYEDNGVICGDATFLCFIALLLHWP